MIRLTYISTAARALPAPAVDAVLMASRRNNRRDAISGLLLYDGRRFLQTLEGDEAQIETTYRRILADPRHRACVMLDRRAIDRRAFGEWDMAWKRLDRPADGATLAETVDQMVSAVDDPSLSALFASFARIDRAA